MKNMQDKKYFFDILCRLATQDIRGSPNLEMKARDLKECSVYGKLLEKYWRKKKSQKKKN